MAHAETPCGGRGALCLLSLKMKQQQKSGRGTIAAVTEEATVTPSTALPAAEELSPGPSVPWSAVLDSKAALLCRLLGSYSTKE